MSASITANRTLELNSTGLLEQYGQQAERMDNNDQAEAMAHSRLSTVLQTSIELKEILRLFHQEASRVLPLDGLSYEHDSHQFEHQIGKAKGHHSHYSIQTDSDYLGELHFYRKKEDFSDNELLKLDRMISLLIFPLRNGLRYHEAVIASMTDGLTGTGNRISLDSVLSHEVDQAHRYKLPLSLLILDLDHFKKINDTYGHSVGDTVLKSIAQTLIRCSRSADMAFRYGGEEFVVVLNKTDTAGAKVSAERLRKAIEKMKIQTDHGSLSVTASIGVASLCHDEYKQELLDRADKALYSAKAHGRNRVTVAEPSLANA